MDFHYNVSRRHLIMIKNPSNCKTAVEMRNALIEARDDTERTIENITYWVEGLNQMIEQFDKTIDGIVISDQTETAEEYLYRANYVYNYLYRSIVVANLCLDDIISTARKENDKVRAFKSVVESSL